jgi:hypothetical protein
MSESLVAGDPAVDARIADTVDLEVFALAEPGSSAYQELVTRCRTEYLEHGLFDLVGFVRPRAIAALVTAVEPRIEHESFEHRRAHNIYFQPSVDALGPDHPALRQFETANRTLNASQLTDTALVTLYEWEPLRRFIAEVLEFDALHPLADDLACVNVMAYAAGQALSWHFDRSPFTTTLLLQRPESGGTFEFRPGLRSDADPNYEGVGRLVAGEDTRVQRRDSEPGTLTVFAGRNAAHRTTEIAGRRDRIVAVFSYAPEVGIVLSDADRKGFYGRS